MAIVRFQDYVFSFKRGKLFANLNILFKFFLKKSFFLLCKLCAFFQYKKKIDLGAIHRIGVYIPVTAGMGDLIMSQTFFQDLRREFPKAHIVLLSKYRDMVPYSFVNEVKDLSKEKLFKQLKLLNEYHFDLLLLPEKSVKGSFLFLRASARYKLGYLSSYCLSTNIKNLKLHCFQPHLQHYYKKSYILLQALLGDKLSVSEYAPSLQHWELEDQNITKDYIVIIPKVLWENRSISFSTLVKIIEEILQTNYVIILAGGSESTRTIQDILEHFSSFSDRLSSNCGHSLNDFASLIKYSKGVICGDSGPMHLAFGFHCPVLSFWGPTFSELRVPNKNVYQMICIQEKAKCPVINCYNMEFKPFCDTCLRLENVENIPEIMQDFFTLIS